MKFKSPMILGLLCLFSYALNAQNEARATFTGKVSSVEYILPLSERPQDLIPADTSPKEAKDKRSLGNKVVIGEDPQTEDDYYYRNKHEMEQSRSVAAPSMVFDAYSSGSQPTDPALAIGPNHVFVVFNTGFAIYNKSGLELVGPTAPNPAIFPNGGCCDLTVSYDNAADRWVLSFLGAGAQIAVSDGPDPTTAGWYIFNISSISDYQKLSVWSDGYYLTDNTGSSNKVWVIERDAALAGDANTQIVSFNLPNISTSGFYSPQVLNITDNNLPANGGATVVYMQDDAWNGVTNDHIKLWTIDVDWNNPGNSTVSAPEEFPTTPFIGVFDNGSFSNLRQPGSGRPIRVDALQATIMNQAQFRKFATHNSAIFNFVVDVDASSEKLAAVRWYEFRQSGDNQPWSLYQEGTYNAPDGRHAWNASMAMDGAGNIGMGYTSMSGPNTASTVFIGSYFTGRSSGDPLGTMTVMEGQIAAGNGKIPGTRYGDYAKMDVDPSDDASFWFITEYWNSGRKGVVGKFLIEAGTPDTEAPSDPSNLVASNITSNSATLDWTASTDNVGVSLYNIMIDGNPVGTSTNTTFVVNGLSPLTTYTASVTAQDAAGNVSGAATTSFTTLEGGGNNPGVIAGYFFETGLEGWIDGGNDCARQATANSYEGNFSIRLRDDSNTSNATSPALDLTGNTEVTIEFHTYAFSMEPGEEFQVQLFNGSNYQTIGQYASGTDFSNELFFSDTIIINSGFATNNRIRFRCLASANNDQIWFDQVIISGDNAVAPTTPSAMITNADLLQNFARINAEKISIYPNPATNEVNIEMEENNYDEVVVISAAGKIVHVGQEGAEKLIIDVTQYPPGMYFVRFVKDGLATTKRFVKH